ncbi:ATP12 family chaperone protein [Pacificispira sp.]|uniref:ATP12 family chaperone protein n=1 Tax=Pacificispira sp. TaxID=2888761 RepID=UPI003B517ADD
MKRFYKTSSIGTVEGGFSVLLDGKPVRTPAKAPLTLPNRALAEAVAAEWADQGDKIVPDTMPQMTLSATAIDRVTVAAAQVAADAAGYAGSDLLCYRADTPVELAQRQAEGWDPVLAWASERYDVQFQTTAGLMPVDQPEETRARFRSVAESFDPFQLTAVHVLTTATGSVLLALAVVEGRCAPAEAFALSRIDETYQEELWGVDEEAAKRRDRLAREIDQAHRFLTLLASA